MAQGDRDVRLRAAEARHEVARLEQSFLTGWAEPQQQLAERDRPRHCALAACRRAWATRSMNDRARAVSSAVDSSVRSAALASALPTLTAAAPARIHSPTLSSDTPPEGTSRRNGSGASTSRMRSEERRVGKSVDLGGRRIMKKKKIIREDITGIVERNSVEQCAQH